jgi:hypothetical protein
MAPGRFASSSCASRGRSPLVEAAAHDRAKIDRGSRERRRGRDVARFLDDDTLHRGSHPPVEEARELVERVLGAPARAIQDLTSAQGYMHIRSVQDRSDESLGIWPNFQLGMTCL